MLQSHSQKSRSFIEEALKNRAYDFTAKYLAVRDFHDLLQAKIETFGTKAVTLLEGVLKASEFSRQTQAHFFYREIAGLLTLLMVNAPDEALTGKALCALKSSIGCTTGPVQRAITEALGALPFSVSGPEIEAEPGADISRVPYADIADRLACCISRPPRLLGRSLVAPMDQGHALLVVKLARKEDTPATLTREPVWMEYLRSGTHGFLAEFQVPSPVRMNNNYVFHVRDVPVNLPEMIGLHPDGLAVGYIADRDYFTYPNQSGTNGRLTEDQFRNIIFKNAWLLGKLTSLGVVHTAPIPLFHNRVQRLRRADGGLYEWPRGGRLDRWLYSCAYPNFGPTGIRDFEHFVSFKGPSRGLYQPIGMHLLSLILVTGSYFRGKDSRRIGIDRQGRPVDARHLFDRDLFMELTKGIYLHYYHGFVGKEFLGQVPVDIGNLTERMIEEMGVDRHMEEILRIADQEQMTNEAFITFLENRGIPREEAKALSKATEDIVLYTGPHLGGFNQRNSLPELIESIGIMASLCIVGKFWEEKFSDAEVPFRVQF